MNIYFDEDNMPDAKTRKTMERAATEAFRLEGLDYSSAALSLSFTEPGEIKTLNNQYRDIDNVTDVLSFPAFEADEIQSAVAKAARAGQEFFIGDIVICEDKARTQAGELGHSYERELIYLFVHSVFHLLGFDHENENERAVMCAREEAVMDALDLQRK